MVAEVLERIKDGLAEAVLVPSSGGVFDVRLGDTLLFSKDQTGRFPHPGEVLEAVRRTVDAGGRD